MLDPNGFYGMPCWNRLSWSQQRKLIEVGTLAITEAPHGWCDRSADLCIETRWDEAPGPRFYCLRCGTIAMIQHTLDRVH